jgi:hypothetical protein
MGQLDSTCTAPRRGGRERCVVATAVVALARVVVVVATAVAMVQAVSTTPAVMGVVPCAAGA